MSTSGGGPRAPLRPGDRVGPYAIEDRIGAGGMGAIYRARHEQTGAVHALKVVHAHRVLAGGQAAFARFHREAEALARVDDHPGIVRVHGFGTHEGFPWCAMELVEGRPLSDVLRGGPLAPREAARLAAAIARAIHHVHDHGIVHRDLKPENVLLDAAGAPRVVDFGLAYDAFAEKLTQSGAALGSPLYMAPEQLRPRSRSDAEADPIGPATDVWALGGILHATLTGRAPFADEQGMGLFAAVLSKEPPRPSARAPSVPPELDAVFARCQQKRAADRYRTAAAVADDLERWLRGDPISAEMSGPLRRLGRRLRRRWRRLLAAAFVLGLAGAALASALRAAPPPPERLATLESMLDVDGRLSDEERRALAALRTELAAATAAGADPDLARRAGALELLAEIAVTDDVAAARERARSLAELVRPDGALDRVLFARAQRVLHRARRIEALNEVVHGARPVGVASPEAAADLAHLLAARDAAPAAFPADDDAFRAIFHAPGLDGATRARLTARRADALIELGPERFAEALEVLCGAWREHAVAPGRAAASSAAFRDHAEDRFLRLLETRQLDKLDEAQAVLDVLMRIAPRRGEAPPELVARTQDILLADIEEERPIPRGKEHGLLAQAYLVGRLASPLGARALSSVMLTAYQADWLEQRGEAEAARGPERRNPVILVMVGSLLAREWAETKLDADLARCVRMLELAMTTPIEQEWFYVEACEAYAIAQRWEVARELAERTIEVERACGTTRRWPIVPFRVANLALTTTRRPDLERCARLLLESVDRVRLERAYNRELARVSALRPWVHEQAGNVHDGLLLLAGALVAAGPPGCCDEQTGVARLLDAADEILADKTYATETVREQHRERCPARKR